MESLAQKCRPPVTPVVSGVAKLARRARRESRGADSDESAGHVGHRESGGSAAVKAGRPPRVRVIVSAVVAIICVAAAAALFVDDSSAPPPVPAVVGSTTQARIPIGVYIGPGDRDGFERFAGWLGRRPALASDGLEELRWRAVVNPWWLVDAWRSLGARIAYSLVMIPRQEGGTLQEGASGAYDVYFRELARRLVDGGQARAILRPGWEFSGDWQPWSARSDPDAWKAYYRRIVTTMRSVPGADFTFVWNPALGPVDPDNWPAERAWPGDDVVDAIGVDAYDICFVPDTYPIPDQASAADIVARQTRCWNHLLTGDHGLEWYADFAARHDRPLVIPEFGLVPRERAGGGDNPVFVQGMADFARAHTVNWMVYFNKDQSELGRHRIDDGTYPQSSALFRSLFGSGSAGTEIGGTTTTPSG
jgi:Glycosyl hydrolase family 26